MASTRAQLADELLRRLAAAFRAGQLYSKGHPIIIRNIDGLCRALDAFHAMQSSVVIGIVEDEVIVDDAPVPKADVLGSLVQRLKQIGIERITIDRGVTQEEIETLANAVVTAPKPFPKLAHIRVGRVTISDRTLQSGLVNMDAFREAYVDAVRGAEGVWDTAQAEGQPDVSVARTMIEGLAQAVADNRPSLLALTALYEYNDYTFTHMVNVSILTMAQARALGVSGPLLREFGMAGLLHDIGKVKTPPEVLNKPGRLDDNELVIMRRHTVDGAEILSDTPDVTPLAPVVAFEHHLRLDGTGYPLGVQRPQLNLGTMLCSIADVYDAMRSKRVYQNSSPTSRILAVLNGDAAHGFDQHLVRRFGQLLGVYPIGNLVKLTSGEIAVVIATHAPEPHRPQVRVIFDPEGARLPVPFEINLWESPEDGSLPVEISGPANPAEVGVDPLSLL
jgi:putative nucleotidyltransferase with HDIG domain